MTIQEPVAEAGGTRGPLPGRQTALIIWSAIVAGVVVFAAVATTVGPRFWQRSSGSVGGLLSWLAPGVAVVGLLTSRLLPGRIKATPGAPPHSVAITRTIIASALNEGAALFSIVAWMLGGSAMALVALAISCVGLLLAFPSAARWQKLGRQPDRATRPNPLVR